MYGVFSASVQWYGCREGLKMATVRAHTNPALLRWARVTAGYSVEDASHRLGINEGRLDAAESGLHLLTLKQAHKAAALYGRPLALLFADEPPNELSVEAKYRRLRGAPAPPWSPQMVALEREVRERQEATVEIYDALGEAPPWREASARLGAADRVPSAEEVRTVLNISPAVLRGPRPADQWRARRMVVQAVEWTGVLVVRQPVPDPGVRGFLLPHDEVPAIYVNSSEHPRAQAFTIVHEFAHLLLQVANRERSDEEAWCDELAGTVLMPENDFREQFAVCEAMDPLARSCALADWFGVSPYAAAVRARRLGLLDARDVVAVRDRSVASGSPSPGGNGNRTKVAKLSPTFTDLVLAAADSSAVTLSTASHLLKTKVEDFDKLRRFTEEAFAA